MNMYLSMLQEQHELILGIISELESTHGGQKYIQRLTEIANEMETEKNEQRINRY